jgi:hypothetical protein
MALCLASVWLCLGPLLVAQTISQTQVQTSPDIILDIAKLSRLLVVVHNGYFRAHIKILLPPWKVRLSHPFEPVNC